MVERRHDKAEVGGSNPPGCNFSDSVAEWYTRRIRNSVSFARAGSTPVAVAMVYFVPFNDDVLSVGVFLFRRCGRVVKAAHLK